MDDKNEGRNKTPRTVEKHWTQAVADEIVESKKPPFVITGGLTTSGPTHLGTVCEFLYPSVIKEILVDDGHKTEFHFIGDIMDAFDSVPSDLEKHKKSLEKYLGIPLVSVPDPLGCHKSVGDHYLSDAQEVVKRMGLHVDVIRINEVYAQGKFDPYAKIFLEKEEETRRIVAETSGRKVEELANWSPIMPICENCGRIATTRVTKHTDVDYEYADDGDVEYTKGCGYKGKAKISDHKYKLQWRLHWPAWQAIFNTAAEGAGKDHHTRGGSWDTAVAIHRQILKREPPVTYKWGFILFEGRKYSKSKGIGMGAREIITLIPPEIVAYLLVEPNAEADKNISPTGEGMLTLFDDVERIAGLESAKTRADQKKTLAFNLTIKKLKWRVKFVDVLTYYQIHRDWDKVSELLGDKASVNYLAPYIEEWLKKKFVPERYSFSLNPGKAKNKALVTAFNDALNEGMNAIDIHNLVYTVAEREKVKPQELFGELYHVLIGKDSGPRFGKLVVAIGVERVQEIFEGSIA